MQSKLTHYFTNSGAALLAAFASALFLCNIADANLVQPREPLLAIPMDSLFWILGLAAIAVAVACIFIIRQPRFKLALILWFAANVVIYRLGLQWLGFHNSHGYLDGLDHTFNLSDSLTNKLSTLLILYLFTGSAALLLWNFLARPEEVPLKAICIHCGGQIAFSAANLGQKIPCPHCKMDITLKKLA